MTRTQRTDQHGSITKADRQRTNRVRLFAHREQQRTQNKSTADANLNMKPTEWGERRARNKQKHAMLTMLAVTPARNERIGNVTVCFLQKVET